MAHPVHTVMRDGNLWWVVADVCAVLELANPSYVAKRLDDEDKQAPVNNEGIAARQVHSFTIINESGL